MKDLGKYYKTKYLNLRSQYIKTIDFAYREGYVKGREDAEKDSLMQQVQTQQMQAQQMQGMPQEGMPQEGQEGAPQKGQAQLPQQERQPPEGTMFDGQSPEEIDGLIDALQQTIEKSEKENPTLEKSLKTLQSIKSMNYSNNLNKDGKMALSEQESLIQRLVSKWDSESSDVASQIMASVRSESF